MITQKPHVAKVTRETIIRLGWETPVHPPYSPDIALSDYHLFHSLDNHLRGRQFRKPHWMDCLLPVLRSSITMEFMVFRHVGRRSSMATVTIFDATGIIFINVWRSEVSSLIPTELFWLPLQNLTLRFAHLHCS
jgi:hypothetical protein